MPAFSNGLLGTVKLPLGGFNSKLISNTWPYYTSLIGPDEELVYCKSIEILIFPYNTPTVFSYKAPTLEQTEPNYVVAESWTVAFEWLVESYGRDVTFIETTTITFLPA